MKLEQRPSAWASAVTKYWGFSWSGMLSPMKSYPVLGIGSMFFMLAEDTHSTLGHSPTDPDSQETKMNQYSCRPAAQRLFICPFIYSLIIHSFNRPILSSDWSERDYGSSLVYSAKQGPSLPALSCSPTHSHTPHSQMLFSQGRSYDLPSSLLQSVTARAQNTSQVVYYFVLIKSIYI